MRSDSRGRAAPKVVRPFVATEPLERRVMLAAEFVAELNPGTLSSTPAWQEHPPIGLRPAGSRVFFRADDGIHGSEIWSSDGTDAGTVMAADISPGPAHTRAEKGLSVGNLFYFVRVVDAPVVPRRELWRTDGTPAGTFRIHEGGYNPLQMTEAMGLLAFTAPMDTAGGYGVWLTDGTAAGTRLIVASDVFAMSGTTDGLILAFTNELINRYDGTSLQFVSGGPAATEVFAMPGYVLVERANPASFQIIDTGTRATSTIANATDPRGFEALSGNRVAFVAGNQPWITDGTAAGTRAIRAPGGGAFTGVGDFAEMDGTLYFAARPPGITELHEGLYKVALAQPTSTAQLVADVYPDAQNSFPAELTPFGGRLYFRAAPLTSGLDVWSTDGTTAGTRLELDLRPGVGVSTFDSNFAVANGRLLFISDIPFYGHELCQLDPGAGPGGAGGSSSYHLVSDVNRAGAGAGYGPGPFDDPRRLPAASAGGKLFFGAVNPLSNVGFEPWVTDGTQAGTRLLKDIHPNFGSNVGMFTPFGDRMYFRASSDYSTQDAGGLWTSDGTTAGTQRVGQFQFASVTWIVPAAGKLVVGTHHDGVWVIDAPGAAPRELRVGATNGELDEPMAPAAVGDRLYFTARDVSRFATKQVFRTDGTDASTVQVSDFTTNTGAGEGVAARGQYFFTYEGGVWASDGTTAGTRRVGTFPAGELEVAGDVVYSLLWTGVLARTDGTPAGSYVLRQFEPNEADSLTAVGDRVFFSAAEPVGDPQRRGRELWTSDGTVAGTVRVKDIMPGPAPGGPAGSSNPQGLFEFGGLLYFNADDGVNGAELWQSDGTAEGTLLARDIYVGAAGSQPMPLGRLGEHFYFAAADFQRGRELWRLDVAAPAPTVTSVYLSGSGWATALKQFMATRGLGSAGFGFAVPAGAVQLGILPWTNLNQMSITFSTPVQVDAADLRVRGSSVANYAIDPSAFTYDPSTRTATWRLAGGAAFGADRIVLDLDGDSPDGVRGPSGVPLDGDWINPVGPGPDGPTEAAGGDAWPSGDGTAGGDFRFRVNILPGDADRSGTVLANDFSQVKQRFFENPSSASYSIFHDVNGSGSILADDFSAVKGRFFSQLPAAQRILGDSAAGAPLLSTRRVAADVLRG